MSAGRLCLLELPGGVVPPAGVHDAQSESHWARPSRCGRDLSVTWTLPGCNRLVHAMATSLHGGVAVTLRTTSRGLYRSTIRAGKWTRSFACQIECPYLGLLAICCACWIIIRPLNKENTWEMKGTPGVCKETIGSGPIKGLKFAKNL